MSKVADYQDARYNPRRITDERLALLKQQMIDLGDISGIVVNRRTGNKVGGHQRSKNLDLDAITWEHTYPEPNAQGTTRVGFVVLAGERWTVREVDWPLEREAIANIAANNPAGEWDRPMLVDILSELDANSVSLDLTGFDNFQIENMLVGRPLEGDLPEVMGEILTAPVVSLNVDAVFESTNPWGIPDLRTDKLSTQTPRTTWNGKKGTVRDARDTLVLWGKERPDPEELEGAVLCFYREDEHHERVWTEKADTLVKLNAFPWGAIIGPDWSVLDNNPWIINVWNVYRSRWCLRFWQEFGFNVIPHIPWTGYAQQHGEGWMYAGIPEGCPVVSIQLRTSTKDDVGKKRFLIALESTVAAIHPENVLLYGGAEHTEWLAPKALPGGPRYHYVESRTQVRRRDFVPKQAKQRAEGRKKLRARQTVQEGESE